MKSPKLPQQRKAYSPRNPQQEKTFHETIPTQKLSGGSIAEVTIDSNGVVNVGSGKSLPFQSNDKFTDNLTGGEAQITATKPVNGLKSTVTKKVKGTSSYGTTGGTYNEY